MNTGLKILLVILGGLMVLCVAGLVFFVPAAKFISQSAANAIGLETVKAEELAAEMVDYQVPSDFEKPYGFRMGDYSLITFLGSDGQSHIYFMQIPEDSKISKEEMLNEAQKMSGGTIGTGFDNANRMEIEVLGQTAPVWLIDGINSANQPYRQAVSIFDGRNGTMMVVFERPEVKWNDAELLEFLASIH